MEVGKSPSPCALTPAECLVALSTFSGSSCLKGWNGLVGIDSVKGNSNCVLYQSATYIHVCLHEHAFLIITEILLYKATSGHSGTWIKDTEGV